MNIHGYKKKRKEMIQLSKKITEEKYGSKGRSLKNAIKDCNKRIRELQEERSEKKR